MTQLHIGTIKSLPVQDHENTKEIGFYSTEVIIDETLFLKSPDKRSHVMKTFGTYLATAVMTTELPTEFWFVEVEPNYAAGLNIPTIISFDNEAFK